MKLFILWQKLRNSAKILRRDKRLHCKVARNFVLPSPAKQNAWKQYKISSPFTMPYNEKIYKKDECSYAQTL